MQIKNQLIFLRVHEVDPTARCKNRIVGGQWLDRVEGEKDHPAIAQAD